MWLYIVIAVPVLFVIGTVYSALKEQKKLEQGELKRVLEKRTLEKHNLLKKQLIFDKKIFFLKKTGQPLRYPLSCFEKSIIFSKRQRPEALYLPSIQGMRRRLLKYM